MAFSVFSSSISLAMVLGPVSCPAEVHCTTVFALQNSKLLRWGGGGEPSIVPAYKNMSLKSKENLEQIKKKAEAEALSLYAFLYNDA